MDGIRVSRASAASVSPEYRVIYYTCNISKLDEHIKLLNWEVSTTMNKGQLVGGINICSVGVDQLIISQAMVYQKE